jgi:uncharacterized repeat protein (TIGR03803 family)
MKNLLHILKLFLLFISVGTSVLKAQYVHPNQAGRRGGDTGPGKGKQVVTSTYYGTAGNPAGQGVIMSVNKDGTNASSFHTFLGYPGDGSYPWYTTPHQASDGNLYGSTYIGGTSNWGTVYKFDMNTASQNVIFNAAPGSGSPGNYGNINELSDGLIYSVQTYAGSSGLGVLVRMDKAGSNLQTIHTFTGTLGTANYSVAADAQSTAPHYDGAYPYGFVVEGPDGKIYGSTYAGGSQNRGSFYRCNKDGTNFEIINVGVPILKPYLNGRGGIIPLAYNAMNPWGNVAIDQTGKVHVTGYLGGAVDAGALACMNADGSDYRILHSGNAAEGYYPYRGGLIIDDRIYGTFRVGGGSTLSGGGSIGVVYSMKLDGTEYKKLKTFDITAGLYADGTDPWSGLSYDGEFLYGTTITNGGVGRIGTIFKVRPDGSDFYTIHRFSNTAGATCGPGTNGLYTYFPSAERVTFADVDVSLSKTCIVGLVCNAGTTAPTLTGGATRANVCPSTTVDLTAITASNLPANTVLKWHTATPATAANAVANPSAVVAGTYYAVFFDTKNGCYGGTTPGSATTSVAVTINSPCCPAGQLSPPLVTNKIQNTCPALTANLLTLTYGAPPSGSPLSWHTGPSASSTNQIKAGNPLTNPAFVPAGTYYAAYNSGGTCFSPTTAPVTVSIVSCNGGIITNTCPTTTIDLTTAITTPLPSGTIITWHTGTPATDLNKVPTPTAVAPATYYPSYYDAIGLCYGNTGAPYVATLVSCNGPVLQTPAVQNGTKNQAKSGAAATELAVTGGTAPYKYYNGSSDPACVAPSGTMPLPASSNLLVNLDGTYTYTTPSAAGTYYFCVKVCDSNPVTPICNVATYKVVVAELVGAGTIDCSKTQIMTSPKAGTAGQHTLAVTINVTTVGCFPITISGSGITLANGVIDVCASSTGIKTFNIPVNYDGGTLGTLSFTIGSAGTCTADLLNVSSKKVAADVWTLDNCTLQQVGPQLK